MLMTCSQKKKILKESSDQVQYLENENVLLKERIEEIEMSVELDNTFYSGIH